MKKLLFPFLVLLLSGKISLGIEIKGFVAKGEYPKSVYLPNPENNILAELFIKKGIEVIKGPNSMLPFISFKIDKEEKEKTIYYRVYIYYNTFLNFFYGGNYIGKFEYIISKEEILSPEKFAEEFVNWLSKNLWNMPPNN